MPNLINQSSDDNNIISQKLFYNGLIPDWAKGANTDLDGTTRIRCPPDDTMGFNHIKISTYAAGYTNYTIEVYALPPAVPLYELDTVVNTAADGWQRFGQDDNATSTSKYHIQTGSPYYTELLTGNQYNYRVIPVMGEYTRIDFVFSGAYDNRTSPGDDRANHLYNKVMLCRTECPLIIKNTLDI
tara:strand:+ start:2812 stop:3366 length:555 start_codon:yes stop_codon:yes gene_type:complete